MISANIIAPLEHLLQNAEFNKEEAAQAISHATSSGTQDQIKYGIYGLNYNRMHQNYCREKHDASKLLQRRTGCIKTSVELLHLRRTRLINLR